MILEFLCDIIDFSNYSNSSPQRTAVLIGLSSADYKQYWIITLHYIISETY